MRKLVSFVLLVAIAFSIVSLASHVVSGQDYSCDPYNPYSTCYNPNNNNPIPVYQAVYTTQTVYITQSLLTTNTMLFSSTQVIPQVIYNTVVTTSTSVQPVKDPVSIIGLVGGGLLLGVAIVLLLKRPKQIDAEQSNVTDTKPPELLSDSTKSPSTLSQKGQPQTVKYCKKCGNLLELEYQYCGKCGAERKKIVAPVAVKK